MSRRRRLASRSVLVAVLLSCTVNQVCGVETIHPRNVHRVASRGELVDFLATAAGGGQIAVLSYEVRPRDAKVGTAAVEQIMRSVAAVGPHRRPESRLGS